MSGTSRGESLHPGTKPGTKKCRGCGKAVPLTDFASSERDGRVSRCKPCLKVIDKAWRETPAGRAARLYCDAKARAKKKGLEFRLTLNWIRSRLDNGVCELSGEAFCFKSGAAGKPHPLGPSLDWIGSSGGYTPQNCRVITLRANLAINAWGLQGFERFALSFLMARNPKLFVKPREPYSEPFTFAQRDLFTPNDVMDKLEALADAVKPPKKRLTRARPALHTEHDEPKNQHVPTPGSKRARREQRRRRMPDASGPRSAVSAASRRKSHAR